MVESPFAIEGPAVISFSGGRTSAFMLRQILDVGLAPDVFVVYANTGKERIETLDFIHEIEMRWGVHIHWLERKDYPKGKEGRQTPKSERFIEVDYATAAREGEPFDAILQKYGYLPNPLMRLCTQELKIRVMKHFMQSKGYSSFTMVEGLRWDEQRRLARLAGRNAAGKEVFDECAPLADARQTLVDVMIFWLDQPFQLQLQPHEGNCDVCFLKTVKKKQKIAQDRPDLLRWWVKKEADAHSTFRIDQPSYANILGVTADPEEVDIEDCLCID